MSTGQASTDKKTGSKKVGVASITAGKAPASTAPNAGGNVAATAANPNIGPLPVNPALSKDYVAPIDTTKKINFIDQGMSQHIADTPVLADNAVAVPMTETRRAIADLSTEEKQAREATITAQSEAEKKKRRSFGFSKAIATSPFGVSNQATTTGGKTLLGA